MAMCDYCIHQGKCPQPQWATIATQANDLYCDGFRMVQMPTISMAYTSPAWVSQSKTVTRRSWQPVTVKRFHKGTKYIAKRSNYGGEALGVGEITDEPFKQMTSLMDSDDYVKEGFQYMDGQFWKVNKYFPLVNAFNSWKRRGDWMTVVPFKVIEVFPGQMAKYTTDEEIKRCVKALVKAIG